MDNFFTAEFLQSVLTGHTSVPGDVTIKDFRVTSGTNPGDNFLSVIYAVEVEVEVNGHEEKHNLVVKRYPPDPSRKEMLQNSFLFQKEYEVYSILLPYMMEFHRRRGTPDTICPATAKCYYGQTAGGEDDCLVLGDLRPSGFRMTDKLVGLDMEHCVLVLEELAKFHALSFAIKEEDPRIPARFPFLKETIYATEDQYIEKLFHSCFSAVLKIVKNDAVHHGLLPRVEMFQGKVLETFISHLNKGGPLTVVCHGDYWVNNFLFQYDIRNDRDVPVAARFIDLQLVCWAPLTTDLLYLFYTSTTAEFRRQHLDQLLETYYNKLSECLGQMNMDVSSILTLDGLKEEFQATLPFGFCTAVWNLPLILDNGINLESVGYTSNHEEMQVKMDEMIATCQENELVKYRVMEMVKEMAEKGVL